jgi:hypothetical protein
VSKTQETHTFHHFENEIHHLAKLHQRKKNKRTNTASSWAPYLGNAPHPGLSATLKSFRQ